MYWLPWPSQFLILDWRFWLLGVASSTLDLGDRNPTYGVHNAKARHRQRAVMHCLGST
jgi:hypothetical protein